MRRQEETEMRSNLVLSKMENLKEQDDPGMPGTEEAEEKGNGPQRYIWSLFSAWLKPLI